MCVDNRDLNRASPKDNFPLPHIDVLVDNIGNFALFSFMEGFSGYNQIKMAPEDMEKTTFVTLWGTFCYKVMSFGLKNAGATYQRAMVALFHNMMHREIKVYVDDMIAKSITEEEHLVNLRRLFERHKRYQLRLKPAKCTFGVKSGKLLGFIVSQKGCMMGQHDELGKRERVVYYLSKKFMACDMNYSLLERTCCAFGLGIPPTKTIHAEPYHLASIQDGPSQVHL